MFSTCLKTLLLLLVLVCARATAARNGSIGGRSFSFFDPSTEPMDLTGVFENENNNNNDVVVEQNLSLSNRPSNATVSVSVRPQISEAALQYLTSPLSTVLIPSFYLLVFLVSVPINVCAVLAFARRIRPKKPAAIYMLNLASADLLFASLLPFKVAYHFNGNDWVFGSLMCRVVTAAFYWNMYCSVLLVACISVDRLVAVVYPIASLAWRRPRNANVACAAAWTLSLAGSVPLVLSEQTFHLADLGVTTCHDVRPVGELVRLYKAYFVTLSVALFFLPLLVVAVSYARVIWALSRVPRGVAGRSRRATRAAVMALTVLVMFVVCFTPTNCLLLAHYLQFHGGVASAREAPDGSYAAYLVFLCVGSLNCLLDPLVYYFGSSQCQKQLLGVLGCQKAGGGRGGGGGSGSGSGGHSTSTSRSILKSSRAESSKIHTPTPVKDSYQADLSSQYKKLLV